MALFESERFLDSYIDSLKLLIAAFFGAQLSIYLNDPLTIQVIKLSITLLVGVGLLYLVNSLEEKFRP